jgi:hypothetical protein
MTATLPPAATTVVCHVRPSLVLDPVDSKVETLRSCEEEGTIESLLLRSWPAEVPLESEGAHPEVVERFQRFEAWAERNDVRIEPPFRTRTSTSVASEERTETLVTPGICLALYHEQQLRCVVPHVDGETTHSVPETIAALRTGTTPAAFESATPVEQTLGTGGNDGQKRGSQSGITATADRGPEACPDCGTTLANVQGMLACVECEWIAEKEQLALASQ